jgi:OOP family OmpA-OmpF porin
MLKKNLLISMLAVAGLMVGASASAQSTTQGQTYVGITAGQSKFSDDCKGTTTCDTKDTAYKLFGGYNFDKNFAIEASYFSLGKASATATVGTTTAKADVKATGFEIAGVVNHEFATDFSGFAKLGLARVTADVSGSAAGIYGASRSDSSVQPVFGLGLTYKISKEIALRTEFETRKVKFDGDKETVRNVSVGVQYTF